MTNTARLLLPAEDAPGRLEFDHAMTREVTLAELQPDLRQARFTSTIADVRVWVDREGADPVAELRAILDELGLAGGRLGVEYDGDQHRTREVFRDDVRRLNALRACGWAVPRFTAADLYRPGAVVGVVARALGQRVR